LQSNSDAQHSPVYLRALGTRHLNAQVVTMPVHCCRTGFFSLYGDVFIGCDLGRGLCRPCGVNRAFLWMFIRGSGLGCRWCATNSFSGQLPMNNSHSVLSMGSKFQGDKAATVNPSRLPTGVDVLIVVLP
jgi:hypothetical protein